MGRFNWCRRLSKDYEILPETTEAFIYVAMIRLMLKQLAPVKITSSKLFRHPLSTTLSNRFGLAIKASR